MSCEPTVRDTVTIASAEATRNGAFDIRQPPYTVHASVALPPAPAAGTMALHVSLDTLRIELRLGCGRANAAGIRAATTTAAGPPWAAIQLTRVEQSPDICASLGVPESRWAPFERAFSRVGFSVGYVAGVGSHNVAFSGVGAMVGVRIWP